MFDLSASRSTRPTPARKARGLAPLVLLVLFAAPAQQAHAQWAVVDPAHIAKSVWNGRKIVDQLRYYSQDKVLFRFVRSP